MENCEWEKLFKYCREGNLLKLRELIEENELDLNIRDKWDSTPLYYACLCGHESVVHYLLENGAKCEANTFDGERCLYSALTAKIKSMLKDYKAITKECMRRDSYLEFFRLSLTGQAYKDVCFIVHNRHIFAHKVVLASRCEYFAKMFETRWLNKRYINIKHRLISETAFELLIQYLYTDRIDVGVEEVKDLKRLAKQCKISHLQEKLDEAERSFESYTTTKPLSMRSNVSIISIQPVYRSLELNESFLMLTQKCLPYHYRMKHFPNYPPDIFFMNLPEDESFQDMYDDDTPLYADIMFNVDGCVFYGHKVFFCGRSDYFKTLQHFAQFNPVQNENIDETQINKYMTQINLQDVSADAFAVILIFIYMNTVEVPYEVLYEVLHFSALYILPALKKICSNQLKSILSTENIIDIIKISRLYGLTQLESSCCEFMAFALDQLVNDVEFRQLILSDAQEIKERHETDTIQIIDDIRFHIHRNELPLFQMSTTGSSSVVNKYDSSLSSEEKFELIESILTELGLDA